MRTGGPVPWGAEVEYAFRTGYDSTGGVEATHVVALGCAAMLAHQEAAEAKSSSRKLSSYIMTVMERP